MSVSTSTAVARIRSARHSSDVRRLFACVFGFLVLAVMTGPSGSNLAPTSGFTGSLLHPRVFVFIALGVALWAIITAQHRWGEAIKHASDHVTALPRRVMPDRPRPPRLLRRPSRGGDRRSAACQRLLAGRPRRPDRHLRTPGDRPQRRRRLRRTTRPRLHRLLRDRRLLDCLLDRGAPRPPADRPQRLLGDPLRDRHRDALRRLDRRADACGCAATTSRSSRSASARSSRSSRPTCRG